MESTLVLNASFEPLDITSATKAINKILSGKAVAVDNSSKLFHAENVDLPIPYVVQMTYMVHRKRRGRLGFSRRGVLVRDNHTCAYCGLRADTIDHVLPRALGGVNSYENCVAACYKCNNKKADHTLAKMGWNLGFVPTSPSPYTMLMQHVKQDSEAWHAWNEYISPWSKVMA